MKSVCLEDLTTLISSGSTPKGGSTTYLDEGPIMFVRSQNVRMGALDLSDVKYIRPEVHAEMQRTHVQKDDVLLNITGASIGRVATFNLPNQLANVNQHVCIIRSKSERLYPPYLTSYLSTPSFQAKIANLQRGGTRQALTFSQIAQFEIPLPPLLEQKRIAAILDKADAIRRKRQEAIRLTEELLRSAFLEMFGDPVTNPKGWEVKPLDQVVDPNRGITYGIVQPGPNVPNGVPYIKTGDIKNNEVIIAGLCKTSSDIAARYKRSEVIPGDLVFSIRATVGTVAVVPDALPVGNLTQGTARIATGPTVLRQYLLGCLRSHAATRWIARQVKGATFKEITLKKLRELPILVPPKRKQEEFAEFCEQQQRLRQRLLECAEDCSSMGGSLTQRAFSGRL